MLRRKISKEKNKIQAQHKKVSAYCKSKQTNPIDAQHTYSATATTQMIVYFCAAKLEGGARLLACLRVALKRHPKFIRGKTYLF